MGNQKSVIIYFTYVVLLGCSVIESVKLIFMTSYWFLVLVWPMVTIGYLITFEINP